jgi:hypothetical protein
METFMDWWLIHRNDAQMEALAREIPASEIQERRIFHDDERNVVYLELAKKDAVQR